MNISINFGTEKEAAENAVKRFTRLHNFPLNAIIGVLYENLNVQHIDDAHLITNSDGSYGVSVTISTK